MRKLFAIIGAVAMSALLVPSPANAAAGDSLVVVFIGDAFVGDVPGNWGTSPNQAPGDGLCFPTLDPATGCGPGGALAQPENGWTFQVPSSGVTTSLGTIPGACNAYGQVGGSPVSTADIPGVDPGNCTIDADGGTFTNAAGVGPSCGMSAGSSTANAPYVGADDDPANGEGPDEFTVDLVGSGPITTNWITSAGGSIPISGTFTLAGSTSTYVGFVQARPTPPPGNIPCLTIPATTFTVVGVTAGVATS